jgi:addiction module HigA family antidote
MKTNKLPPIHPGEILQEEFMKPRGLSQNALARALNVPPRRINEIVLEKRGITADTALRLARYFGTSAEMWTGLQADYDLRLVRYEKARTIEREVEPLAALQPVIAAGLACSPCCRFFSKPSESSEAAFEKYD